MMKQNMQWFVASFWAYFLGAMGAPVLAQSIVPAADGTGTIVTPTGQQYDIHGGTLSGDGTNLFHSFQQFGLDPGQIANFQANPALRNILSRVIGGDPSVINGLLQITGGVPNLYLLNPAGLIFGSNAQLNLPADFSATTATGMQVGDYLWDLQTTNYANLNGTPTGYLFSTLRPGLILNAGNLSVAEGSNLSLIAGTVLNTGTLNAPGGNITVVAAPGNSVVRISAPGNLLSIEVEVPQDTLGNALPFTAGQLPDLLTTGIIPPGSGVSLNDQGQAQLTASGTVIANETGISLVSGSLLAENLTGTLDGSQIQVFGNKVALVGATLDVSGSNGGGTILVGGDYKGQGTVPNAQFTFVSSDSTLNADALTVGNGGKVIVWADDTTRFFGTLSAQGGSLSGNGGFAEVSGKENLTFAGFADLGASQGSAGTLLLDPTNILINNVGPDSSGVDGALPDILSSNLSGDITISQATLEALSGNSNIILEATNNITITSLANNKLHLGGTGNIIFSAGVSTNGTGTGAFIMDVGSTLSIDSSSTSSQRTLEIRAGSGGINVDTIDAIGGFNNNGSIITLDSGGEIVVNRNIASFSVNGFGGKVSLTASGDITVKGNGTGGGGNTAVGIETFGPAGSGDITLSSTGGSIDTTGGNLNANGRGGRAGTITIEAYGDINTSDLITRIEDNTSTLSAGAIALTSQAGSINTSSTGPGNLGNIYAHGTKGAGGNVSFNAANTVTVGGLNTTGGDGSGLINLNGTEVNLVGGAESVQSAENSLTLQPKVIGQNLILGGPEGTTPNTLYFSATDLAALATTFSSLTFGRTDGTGSVTVHTDGITLNNPSTIQTGTGTLILEGNIATPSQTLTLNGATQVTNAVTLSTAATGNGANLTLNGTVDGPGGLTLNAGTAGTLQFGGNIGSTTPLASLSVTSAQSTSIPGNITTNGNITFNSPVNLTGTGAASVNAGTGSILFNSTLATNAKPLTLTADTAVTFSSAANSVSGTSTLQLQSFSASRDLFINGTGNGLSLTNLAALANGFASLTLGRSDGSGVVTVASPTTFQDPALIQSPNGQIAVNAPLTGTDDASLTLASTLNRLNADITTSSQALILNGATQVTNAVTLNTAATGNGANLTLNGTVDGPGGLTLNAGTAGTLQFGGNIGSTTPLASLSVTSAQSTTIPGNITTSNGNISFSSPVNLTGAGAVSFTAGTGSISFNDTLAANAKPLTLIADTAVTFSSTANSVSGTSTLQLQPFSASRDLFINGTGNGLSLTNLASLANGFASLTLGRADGSGVATVASDTTVQDPTLIQSSSGQIVVNAPVVGTDNASLTLTSSLNRLKANLTTAGQNLTLNGNSALGSPVTLSTGAAGGNLVANGSIEGGNQPLTLNAGTGNITLNGIAGSPTPLGSLSLAASNLFLNGGIQTISLLNIPVSTVLTGTSTLTSQQGNVTLNAPVTSQAVGSGLTVNSPMGSITAGNISTETATTGGDITLLAPQGTVTTGNLTSRGTRGGNIFVQASGNNLAPDNRVGLNAFSSISLQELNSSGSQGNGGNVTLDPFNNVVVSFINAQGGTNGRGGNVIMTTTGSLFAATSGFVDQNGLFASISTAGGQGGGDITLTHFGGDLFEFFNAGVVSPGIGDYPSGTAGVLTTGADNVISNRAFPGSYTQPGGSGTIRIITSDRFTVSLRGDLPNPDVLEPLPVPDTDLFVIEEYFTRQYDYYFGNATPTPIKTLDEIQDTLRRVEKETGVKPAIIYAFFVPSGVSGQEGGTVEGGAPQGGSAAYQFKPPQERLSPSLLKSDTSAEDIYWRFVQGMGITTAAGGDPTANNGEPGRDRSLVIGCPPLEPKPVNLQEASGEACHLELVVVTGDPNQRPVRVSLPQASQTLVLAEVKDLIREVGQSPEIGAENNGYVDPSQELYRWLVQSLKERDEGNAIEGIDNLVFVMDSGLRSLPIAALHTPNQGNVAKPGFIIEEYSVGLMPSMSLTDTHYTDIRQFDLMAMGRSEFGSIGSNLRDLPTVATQIEEIDQIWSSTTRGVKSFVDGDFTPETLRSQRRNFGIVHLSTHAKFELDSFEKSYIQFSSRDPFYLPKVRELQLYLDPVTELLVLGACDTALGNLSAELGFGGFAHQAGVKSVLSSLWSIEAVSTLALLIKFYEELTPEKTIKAEALRQAQLALMSQAITYQDTSLEGVGQSGRILLPSDLYTSGLSPLNHPYYWSGLTIVGSPW